MGDKEHDDSDPEGVSQFLPTSNEINSNAQQIASATFSFSYLPSTAPLLLSSVSCFMASATRLLNITMAPEK